MPYDDAHRAVVQAFLGRHVMTVDEAKPVFAAILSVADDNEIPANEITEGTINGYVGAVNDELSKFDLEIRSMRDQIDRRTIYALVNTTSDDIIQCATNHSADEIAFFRRVLDAMFETNNTLRAEVLAVKRHDAIHLHKNPPRDQTTEVPVASTASSGGLSLKGAEDALTKFVDEGWLLESKKNWYSLAPRALMELSLYLTQTYNTPESEEDEAPEDGEKIKCCYACKELLTVGQRCDKLRCPTRLHNPCAEQFFSVHKGRKCPQCKTAWSGKEPVGEAAAGALRKKVARPRVSGAATPRQRAPPRRQINDEDEETEQSRRRGDEGEGDSDEDSDEPDNADMTDSDGE